MDVGFRVLFPHHHNGLLLWTLGVFIRKGIHVRISFIERLHINGDNFGFGKIGHFVVIRSGLSACLKNIPSRVSEHLNKLSHSDTKIL